MADFFNGWGFTGLALGLIAGVFCLALVRLGNELRWVRQLTDLLGAQLAGGPDGDGARRLPPSLLLAELRDQAAAVVAAADPVWAQKQVRTWQMRAGRIEPALAFWVDLLRQLGLLGTVVGLGLSLAMGAVDPARLLGPLGLAVWTTVAGLALSIWLSAQYSGQLAAWADACEKTIEAWDVRRRARTP